MLIMKDQYHQLGENGAASHQSIVQTQSVAEANMLIVICVSMCFMKKYSTQPISG